MKTTFKTLASLTLGAAAVIPQLAQADSYVNYTQNIGAVNSGTTEFGNQVFFTGGNVSVTVTNFSAQIYGTYGAGDTVDVRFYGVTGSAANGYTYTPGPVLFDSGAIDLSSIGSTTPGVKLVLSNDGALNDLPVAGVTVPNTFVFTLQFGGPHAGGNGLALFGPSPTDGGNNSDAWEFDAPGQASGWVLVTNGDITQPYNIGASVAATPEPSSIALFGFGALALVALGARRRLAVR
jgi:hypothetical protein